MAARLLSKASFCLRLVLDSEPIVGGALLELELASLQGVFGSADWLMICLSQVLLLLLGKEPLELMEDLEFVQLQLAVVGADAFLYIIELQVQRMLASDLLVLLALLFESDPAEERELVHDIGVKRATVLHAGLRRDREGEIVEDLLDTLKLVPSRCRRKLEKRAFLDVGQQSNGSGDRGSERGGGKRGQDASAQRVIDFTIDHRLEAPHNVEVSV